MQARLKNAKNEDLWLAAIRLEQRAKNGKAADAAMAKALQECPASGRLWAEAVAMAPRPARRARSVDALKRCNDDPHIIAAIAQLFWHDRKVRAHGGLSLWPRVACRTVVLRAASPEQALQLSIRGVHICSPAPHMSDPHGGCHVSQSCQGSSAVLRWTCNGGCVLAPACMLWHWQLHGLLPHLLHPDACA